MPTVFDGTRVPVSVSKIGFPSAADRLWSLKLASRRRLTDLGRLKSVSCQRLIDFWSLKSASRQRIIDFDWVKTSSRWRGIDKCNSHQNDIRHLWEKLDGKKRFPLKELVPMNRRLQDLM